MNISRRFFLGGALAVASSAVLPIPALASYPVLHGDGVHDDTEAFNALLRGATIVCEGEVIQAKEGEPIAIRPGTYRVSALHFHDGKAISGTHVHLRVAHGGLDG